jgi:hypothetical protein
VRIRLIGARDLIIDSVPILAWRRADPDAAPGYGSFIYSQRMDNGLHGTAIGQ